MNYSEKFIEVAAKRGIWDESFFGAVLALIPLTDLLTLLAVFVQFSVNKKGHPLKAAHTYKIIYLYEKRFTDLPSLL